VDGVVFFPWECTDGPPVSVIAFHGKADPTLPYDGGPGDAGAGLSWLSVADSVAFSVRQNGCTGQPEVTTSADGNVITDDYTHCADGSEVLTYTIVSAGHYGLRQKETQRCPPATRSGNSSPGIPGQIEGISSGSAQATRQARVAFFCRK
jgi:poly(3-hydroxybutyrate) depolymerase